MIYITGDCHSNFRKFNVEAFPEQKEMTKDDIVIITGDFGGVWYQLNSKEIKSEDYWLDWLNNKPFTTIFVDGNHENFKRLNSYPVKEWHGGKIHEIRSNIFHLIRGEVFEIEGKTFFAFGGAKSHDISDGIVFMDKYGYWKQQIKRMKKDKQYYYRIKDLSWWDEEMPTEHEMAYGLENLKKHNNDVDYIITHCCPQEIASFYSKGFFKPDDETIYFNFLAKEIKFKNWFFGHYHDDKQIMGKFFMLYDQIIRIL